MSDLEKISLKFSLFFTIAFFLFSEIWDILIYILFPNIPRVITNFAASILHPNDISKIVIMTILTIIITLFSAILLAWLLRKLGATVEFFERQRWWVWFLAGVIFSLSEFQELLGPGWSNMLFLVFLICLGFVYFKNKETKR